MQRVRRAVQPAISVVGMLVVFGGVLWVPPTNVRLTILVVLVGVLILEAGVWGLANHILPSSRQYVALREEGDGFILLVRKLNAAALQRSSGAEGGEERFQELLSLMHDSVERMGEVAGEEG